MKIIVGNIAAEYRDEGNGPVMLLLHGWKDNLHTFDPLVPLLSDKWRVVRVDLPGFGQTEVPDTAWYLDDYVGFVKNFLDKLGVRADVLVGHSFGGRITIKGIATNIIPARTIILIASAGIAKTHTLRNASYKALAKTGKLITGIPPFRMWRRQLWQKLYQQAGSGYPEAGPFRDTFLHIIKEDVSSAASQISTPALLIWGSQDMETPLHDGKRLSELIRGSRLEVIFGAGHFVHRQHPDTVARLIREFAL